MFIWLQKVMVTNIGGLVAVLDIFRFWTNAGEYILNRGCIAPLEPFSPSAANNCTRQASLDYQGSPGRTNFVGQRGQWVNLPFSRGYGCSFTIIWPYQAYNKARQISSCGALQLGSKYTTFFMCWVASTLKCRLASLKTTAETLPCVINSTIIEISLKL